MSAEHRLRLGAVAFSVTLMMACTAIIGVGDYQAGPSPDGGHVTPDGGTPGCPTDEVSCGGSCVKTASDPSNCGTCGHSCAQGQVCASGTCACADSTATLCSGVGCVDLQTSKGHCGACATTCQDPTSGTSSCVGGSCVVSCNNGYVTLGAANNYCCPNKPFGKGICDVSPECGCDANQNCTRLSGAPESCVPDGTAPPGESCNTTNDCSHGLVCADLVCDPLCIGTCPETNYQCLLQFYAQGYADGSYGGGGGTYLGYGACKAHCNPANSAGMDTLHAACTGSGQRCEPMYDQAAPGRTYCASSHGTGTRGTGCPTTGGGDYSCAPNYVCVQFSTTNAQCEPFCHVGTSECAPFSLTCNAFSPAAYDGNQQLGYCN